MADTAPAQPNPSEAVPPEGSASGSHRRGAHSERILAARRRRRGLLRAAGFVAVGLLLGAAGTALLLLDEPGQPRAGALLGTSAVLLGLGLASFARHRFVTGEATEERHAWSPPCIGCRGEDPHAGRRRLLVGGGALAAAAVGGALVLRQDDRAQRGLRNTAWQAGSRLMTADGRPVMADDLDVGALVTVWPEQAVGAADSQVVLIRVEPERVIVTEELRRDWSPEGFLAYSRLCTHMACPLGLYQQDPEVLVCPCHQATFDVLRAGVPLQGPASRALPQLPLMLDPDGTLRARSDFIEPVGASWWDRER
jgi:ubiquinol-cytochrome c reductase iron-sulfur subunit